MGPAHRSNKNLPCTSTIHFSGVFCSLVVFYFAWLAICSSSDAGCGQHFKLPVGWCGQIVLLTVYLFTYLHMHMYVYLSTKCISLYLYLINTPLRCPIMVKFHFIRLNDLFQTFFELQWSPGNSLLLFHTIDMCKRMIQQCCGIKLV